jgi:hypothetical protein
MAYKLQLKRGASGSLPTGIAGEPLFTTDTNDLYIGTGASNQRYQKYIASGTSSQFLKGDGSLDSNTYAFDSAVVKLTGTQSISGEKTFSDTSRFGLNILMFQNSTVNFQTGYSTFTSDSGGFYLALDTNKRAYFNVNGLSTQRNYTFPNATGTIALTSDIPSLSGYVTGTGTTNYLPKWTSGSALGNSSINEDAGGNILIGANTSGYGTLNVQRNAAAPYATLTLTDDATPANPVGIYLRANGSSPAGISCAGGGSIALYLGGPGASEGMRLTSTGLGIGTTSPSAKLDVVGAVRVSNSGVNTTFDSGAATDARLEFKRSGTRVGLLNWDSGLLGVQLDGSGYFYVSTGGSERMRLDTSGNLGLGVVPSAWRSNEKVLQIGTASSFYEVFGLTVVGNNYYTNSSNNSIYLTSSYASFYAQSSGQHQWHTAPSGTAGNAISFTQAMTLDASGNLLLSTTSTSVGNANALVAYGGTDSGILYLHRTTGTDQLRFYVGGNRLGYINTASSILTLGTANFPLALFTNDTERLRITSGGNVGIGTTSPAEKLDVRGKVYINNGGELFIDPNGSSTILASTGARPMNLEVNGANRLTIKTNGIINLANVPTSSVGLSSGDIYSSAGVLMIV